MNFIDRIKSGYREFNKTTNNFSGRNDFLKNGNNRAINSNWSSVNMSDEDFYTGYSYAAINNRANKTAQIAMKYLKTVANEQTTDMYKKRGDILDHPYLKLIRDSIEFSEYDFWYDISTYLDLEGISYILVTRTIQDDRVGNAMEFEVLNPYEVKRIRNSSTLEIGGYTESRNGLIREINPKQIIETRKLNPFSRDNPFAMTDAAKDSQFTLKQAGDYTRHSLKGNQNTPGIISTDVLLDPEQFKNFVNRIQNQEKGSPLFGNGAGAINWNSMQVDLDKAALDKINEISRSTLFAVSGMSKTSMGIEESGTTRDVSKTQTDNLIENHIMPQIQKVIDSFNLDYKKYSPAEYKKDKLTIIIDNPLGKDKEVELKEITIAADRIKLRQELITLGYTIELASKYANGEIELDELGLPTEEVKQVEAKTKEEPKSKVDDSKKEDKQAVEDAKTENAYLKELVSFLVQKRKDQAKLVTVDNYNKNHDGSGKFSSGPGGSTILDSLNPTGGLLVKYEPEKRAKAKLGGKLTTLDKTMGGKPDDIITIYRGAPSIQKEIVPGDYITDLRELAVSYTGDGNIISKKVRKGDILDDSSESLGNEYIYRPNADKEFEKKSNNAIQDSLPVINQVNIIEDQQNALKSTINKIQADIIKSVLSRVTQNAFDSQDDIIYASDRKESEDELEKQLTLFYIALFLIYGPQLLNKRKSEFEDVKGTRFILTPQVKSKINDFAKKASKSHIDTILNDLLDTSNIAYDKAVETEVAKILQTITKDDIDKLIKGLDKKQSEKLIEELNKKEAGKEIYELARKRALEGQGRAQIVASIRKEYKDISKTRATTIARTETQRAFNQSQYQADVQFLTDNDLMDRAYKQWKTRSANPCQYCIDLSKEPPIPFDMNFRDMGDELSYIYTKKDGSKVKRSLQVDYEELSAGNAHVNCGCVYILIIKDGNGNFVQSFEINVDEFDKIENYNKNHDGSGRFSSGPGGAAPATLSELYSKYSGLEETLRGMNELTASYSQKEYDRLDGIYDAISTKEKKLYQEKLKLDKELTARGLDYDAVHTNPKYIKLKKEQDVLMSQSAQAFSELQKYANSKEVAKAVLKEKLYKSVYGDDWLAKHDAAASTLRNWAENKYGNAKKGIKGENYGTLELEHALTQAYYLDKGIKEVEIKWGLNGKAAQDIIDGDAKIKASISSVTTNKDIANSYAAMGRITTSTKRAIMDRTKDLPTHGVVVKAKVPVDMVIISYQTAINTGMYKYDELVSSMKSPGAFLKDQDELIISVPKKADVSSYDIIETDSGIEAMHKAALRGERWENIR